MSFPGPGRGRHAGLTRISHQVSTAAADPGMSTALRSVGFLDVPSSTPAESSRRAPCIHARLRRLATKLGEKCGLAHSGISVTHFRSPHSLGMQLFRTLRIVTACLRGCSAEPDPPGSKRGYLSIARDRICASGNSAIPGCGGAEGFRLYTRPCLRKNSVMRWIPVGKPKNWPARAAAPSCSNAV